MGSSLVLSKCCRKLLRVFWNLGTCYNSPTGKWTGLENASKVLQPMHNWSTKWICAKSLLATATTYSLSRSWKSSCTSLILPYYMWEYCLGKEIKASPDPGRSKIQSKTILLGFIRTSSSPSRTYSLQELGQHRDIIPWSTRDRDV